MSKLTQTSVLLSLSVCCAGTFLFVLGVAAQSRTWVDAHTRKDGTRVKGHWRNVRGGTKESNAAIRARLQMGGESPVYVPKRIERYNYQSQPTQMEPSWVRQQRLERSQGIGVAPATRRAPTLAPTAFTGQCIGVSDGDTTKVMRGGKAETIRLHAIDAPEKAQPFPTLTKKLKFPKLSSICPVHKKRVVAHLRS
jgi:hypothetical protein